MFFLDFLFPKKCLGCDQKGQYFCSSCQGSIRLVEHPICPVCCRLYPTGQTHCFCQTRYTINGLVSVFVYQGVVRKAIGKLKYRFQFDLAKELVDLMLDSLARRYPEFISGLADRGSFLVVAVPLHQWRQDWRGFNQSALLAKILAKKLDLPFCEDLLVRKHHTPPQTGLKKEARQKNVEKAFEVNEKYKTNRVNKTYKQVVAFDDVWTTGATMRTCANLLKRAGFEKVWGLTLAR